MHYITAAYFLFCIAILGYILWKESPTIALTALIGILILALARKIRSEPQRAKNMEAILADLAQRSRDRLNETRSHQRRPDDWDIRRKHVLERDGHKCQKCGATSSLQVHHIVPVKIRADHSGSNLITLCVECHSKEEGHGKGLIAVHQKNQMVRAKKFANAMGYDLRRGNRIYKCSTCKSEIPKGTLSYVKKSENSNGTWISHNARICKSCFTS